MLPRRCATEKAIEMLNTLGIPNFYHPRSHSGGGGAEPGGGGGRARGWGAEPGGGGAEPGGGGAEPGGGGQSQGVGAGGSAVMIFPVDIKTS